MQLSQCAQEIRGENSPPTHITPPKSDRQLKAVSHCMEMMYHSFLRKLRHTSCNYSQPFWIRVQRECGCISAVLGFYSCMQQNACKTYEFQSSFVCPLLPHKSYWGLFSTQAYSHTTIAILSFHHRGDAQHRKVHIAVRVWTLVFIDFHAFFRQCWNYIHVVSDISNCC